MSELQGFRADTRAWLAENCPPGARGPGPIPNGSSKIQITDADTLLWLERMETATDASFLGTACIWNAPSGLRL